MTKPSFSLRHVALAVTTITVAFGAGQAQAQDAQGGETLSPANDTGASAYRYLEQPEISFGADARTPLAFEPVFDPYADRQARSTWSTTGSGSAPLQPAARLVEASARGYLVQVGAFGSSETAHKLTYARAVTYTLRHRA